MVETSFQIERVRQEAARSLPLAHYDEFLRLTRSMLHGPSFQWLLVDAPDEAIRRRVMQALGTVLQAARMRSSRLPLSDRIADVAALEQRLVRHAANSDVVHVIGRPGWFTAERWDAFNVRRERIAAEARARLVFWLDGRAIELASLGAPDLWAWRSGVYSFQGDGRTGAVDRAEFPTIQVVAAQEFPTPDSRSLTNRSKRIVELREFLNRTSPIDDEMVVAPTVELGRLLRDIGDYDAALAHWIDVELPLHRRRHDLRSVGITVSQIADILLSRGRHEEALAIYQEEIVPIFDRIGDKRSAAVARGKMADTLLRLGRLGEARKLLEQHVITDLEVLGDLHAVATAKGQLADLMLAEGHHEEALRILTSEVLPVFEASPHPDIRGQAITQSRIADVMQFRGETENALEIRRNIEIPLYEKIGDRHARAIALGRIADLLLLRGQLAEALKIRTDVEIPEYEALGDELRKAMTTWKAARQLQAFGYESKDKARAQYVAAYRTLKRLGPADAERLAKEMVASGLEPP